MVVIQPIYAKMGHCLLLDCPGALPTAILDSVDTFGGYDSPRDIGFHKWEYPNQWMVYFMENPKIEWMMTGSIPILGNSNHIIESKSYNID